MELFRLTQKEKRGYKRVEHRYTKKKGGIVERGGLEIGVALSMTGIETMFGSRKETMEGVIKAF